MKSPTFTKIVITKTYACPISGIAQVTLFAACNGCKRLAVTTRFSRINEQGLVFARTRSSWSLPERRRPSEEDAKSSTQENMSYGDAIGSNFIMRISFFAFLTLPDDTLVPDNV
jgi:hypothetical protein